MVPPRPRWCPGRVDATDPALRVERTATDDPGRGAWLAASFDDWYDVLVAGEAVGRTDPAPWQRAELRAETERGRADAVVHRLLLRERGEPVASAELLLPSLDNTGTAYVAVVTAPAHRRRGLGTRLLAEAVEVAAAAGRDVLQADVDVPAAGPAAERERVAATWPGMLAARAWGFVPGLEEARRQLDLPVPEEVLHRLEEQALPHAAGYAVRTVRGPVDEADVDAVAALMARMSTDAPQGELTVEPERWDAARVREGEALRAAQGRRQWLALAQAPDGSLAGYTMLVQSEHEPERLLQWDTLVLREHRGHRLGLLLKIACLRAATADASDARRVSTWNAVSNTPMIAVNEAMGFRWDETSVDLEAPLATVRAALAARTSAGAPA